MVYGLLRALPGDRALLPPSSLRSSLLKNLTPASRRQDHTTSPSASGALVRSTLRVHRIPPHVRDDRETPLWETGRGNQYYCFYLAVNQNSEIQKLLRAPILRGHSCPSDPGSASHPDRRTFSGPVGMSQTCQTRISPAGPAHLSAWFRTAKKRPRVKRLFSCNCDFQKTSEGCCRIVVPATLRMLDRLEDTAHLCLANDCVGQSSRRPNDSTCKSCRGDRCCNVRALA